MKVWRIIAQAPANTWHLVLEDDVEFTDDTVSKLNTLQEYIHRHNINALINIHCSNPYQILCSLPTSKGVFDKDVPVVGNGFAVGTPAYILTPSIAQQLLHDAQGKVQQHLDIWLSSRYGEKTTPPYLVTKERLVKTNYNSKNSGNMSRPVLPLLSMVLQRFELEELEFMFNVTLFTIALKHNINMYTVFFLLLFLINVFILKNTFIYMYLALELAAYILISIRTHMEL
jgi:GR25 family glycosyltransferase involved in LPS biosynthesis